MEIVKSGRAIFIGSITVAQLLNAGVTQLSVTPIKDTHSAWSGSVYNVKKTADYEIEITSFCTIGSDELYVYVGGIQTKVLTIMLFGQYNSGKAIVTNVAAGQIIDVRSRAGGTNPTIAGTTFSSFSIKELV